MLNYILLDVNFFMYKRIIENCTRGVLIFSDYSHLVDNIQWLYVLLEIQKYLHSGSAVDEIVNDMKCVA